MSDSEKPPFCPNGGLTLVPTPGYVEIAKRVKDIIEANEDFKRTTPVNIREPEFGTRSNGEPFIKLAKENIGGHDCVVLTSGPASRGKITDLLMLLSQLKGRRAQRIAVISGYFPLGRSDKDEGELEFALPSMLVNLLISATYDRLDRIIGVDFHSSQLVMAGRMGLITEVSMVRRLVVKAILEARETNDRIVICFPDDGSAKRSSDAVKEAFKYREIDRDYPCVFGIKSRVSSHEVASLELFSDTGQVQDSTVIFIDDEIASGSTLLRAATDLKETFGAKSVFAAATHAVFCGPAKDRFSSSDCPVDKIIITDTISFDSRPQWADLIKSGKVCIMTWADDLAQIVYRHHWNETIRDTR